MMHFCSCIFDYANMRAEDVRLIANEEIRNYGKLCTSKTFLKTAGGKMHTFYPNPLSPLLAIIYRNHQKSLTYFSHLAPLILFFFTKRQSQIGRAWHNAHPYPPKYAPVRNSCVLQFMNNAHFY